MVNSLRRFLSLLDLEDRILHAAALVAMVSVLFPWISGEWLGGEGTVYTGLSFFTGALGWTILLLNLSILVCTFVPLLGGPVLVRRRTTPLFRLIVASQTMVLTIAALTVLTNVTFEFSRMEVRFGIYLTLIGSMVTSLYAFLQWQQLRRRETQELFHHPEQAVVSMEPSETRMAPPPPPPPPPPLQPEEHHLHG